MWSLKEYEQRYSMHPLPVGTAATLSSYGIGLLNRRRINERCYALGQVLSVVGYYEYTAMTEAVYLMRLQFGMREIQLMIGAGMPYFDACWLPKTK